ncbi:MAG: hypothetical protein KBS59_05630, partial [Clostridiales bacterium]|nr:hypothetical protein [Clostridiales bacterium]
FSFDFIENENEDAVYGIKNAFVFETVGYYITAEQRGLVDGKYKYDIIIWRTAENTDGYVDETVKGVVVFYEEPVTVEFILNVTPYVSPAEGTTISPKYLPSTEPYIPGGTTEPYIPTQSGNVSGTLDMTTNTTGPLMTTNPNP